MLVKGVQGGSKLREEVVCGGAGTSSIVQVSGVVCVWRSRDEVVCGGVGSCLCL